MNSMCPGWVRTDMGGPNATRSVEEGADTGVWLATEADQSLTGRFFRDRSKCFAPRTRLAMLLGAAILKQ